MDPGHADPGLTPTVTAGGLPRTPAVAADANRAYRIRRMIAVTSSVKYDAGAESTPALAKKAADAGKLMLDVSDSACLCGCKSPTPGRFRPGHDARLKGKLARAAIAKVKVVVIDGDKEEELTARAFAKRVSTDAYDWTVALDRAVEAAKAKATKMPPKQAVKEAVKEEVGAAAAREGDAEQDPPEKAEPKQEPEPAHA